MIWKIYSNFGDVDLSFGKFYPFCDATFPQLICIICTRLSHEEMKFLDFIKTLLLPLNTYPFLTEEGGTPYLQERESDGPISQTSCLNYQGQAHCRRQKNCQNTSPFSPPHTTPFLTEEEGGTPYLQGRESDAPISQTSLPELLTPGSLPP